MFEQNNVGVLRRSPLAVYVEQLLCQAKTAGEVPNLVPPLPPAEASVSPYIYKEATNQAIWLQDMQEILQASTEIIENMEDGGGERAV